jgi:hypothetical protein
MALLKQLACIIPTLQIRAERLVLEKAQKAKAALEVNTYLHSTIHVIAHRYTALVEHFNCILRTYMHTSAAEQIYALVTLQFALQRM